MSDKRQIKITWWSQGHVYAIVDLSPDCKLTDDEICDLLNDRATSGCYISDVVGGDLETAEDGVIGTVARVADKVIFETYEVEEGEPTNDGPWACDDCGEPCWLVKDGFNVDEVIKIDSGPPHFNVIAEVCEECFHKREET